ncbi:hypothetical protein AGMMS49982_24010 [Bacteroidia bacterium]|nr:hypothetical protein AGMMS49982_24010 [Bacteroidia bacterium]
MKDLYGLIGYPLKHSFSRNYFNDKFAAEKIDAEYVNFEIPAIQDFKLVIKNNPNLKGLNVTIPYKEQVIPLLDGLDSNAKAIGAVNVIKFDRSQKGKLKLIGYNSDVIGFKESIATEIKYGNHQQALILGSGGAAKAVFHGLKQLGVTSTFVSRGKTPCLCGLDPHSPPDIQRIDPRSDGFAHGDCELHAGWYVARCGRVPGYSIQFAD